MITGLCKHKSFDQLAFCYIQNFRNMFPVLGKVLLNVCDDKIWRTFVNLISS